MPLEAPFLRTAAGVLAVSLVAAALLPDAWAKRRPEDMVHKVPSIEEVVAAEGFAPTLSQSEMYRPGAVLVPNGRGGHDVVVEDCIGVEPSAAIMSQSSIATTLSGGVSARLAATKGSVQAGVEKRLTFVDPEQRTISLGELVPTAACKDKLAVARGLRELDEAIVVHDVLVAIVQNTVCTRADASGQVVALGAAEAAAYSECVQESNAQVPLGYKSVPLSKVLAIVGGAPPPNTGGGLVAPAGARATADFGGIGGGLDVQAQLKEQACADEAQTKGGQARAARIKAAARDAQGKASASWNKISGDLEACTALASNLRGTCITTVEQWLGVAQAMRVELPAGMEEAETACGVRSAAFPSTVKIYKAKEVDAARELLKRLKAKTRSAVKAAAQGAAGQKLNVSKSDLDALRFGVRKGGVEVTDEVGHRRPDQEELVHRLHHAQRRRHQVLHQLLPPGDLRAGPPRQAHPRPARQAARQREHPAGLTPQHLGSDPRQGPQEELPRHVLHALQPVFEGEPPHGLLREGRHGLVCAGVLQVGRYRFFSSSVSAPPRSAGDRLCSTAPRSRAAWGIPFTAQVSADWA